MSLRSHRVITFSQLSHRVGSVGLVGSFLFRPFRLLFRGSFVSLNFFSLRLVFGSSVDREVGEG